MANITNTALYDRDFYAWLNEQAGLLRDGRLSELDIENVVEEIESLGRAEKRELVSRLKILLTHLLKWQYQMSHRSASWQNSIYNARDDLADLLKDSPSLKPQLGAVIESAYQSAVRQAAAETELAESLFPPTCPWSFAQMIDADFWPEGINGAAP
jgi:hypothetical protein